jgi:RND family efflux transporter MFP subunit
MTNSAAPNRSHLGVAGFLIALALLAGCGKTGSAAAPADPSATPVKVLLAKPTTVEETSEYVATIKSRFSTTVQPDAEGQVTRIFVRSGEHVAPGTRLMEIDPLKQSATLKSQEASRNSKQANLDWARIQLDRAKKLYAAGVSSRQELDQAQTAFDAAQADLAALDEQVREQKVELQYYNVVARDEGIVGDIPVHVGDRVTKTTVLTTIDQNRGLEAYISVPTERSGDVRMGAPVEILDGDGKVIANCRVTFISPQVDTATQSILVKAAVDRPREDLRASQFVRARMVWRSHPGFVVPVVAISRIGGQFFAFFAEPGPKGAVARQRPLKLGEITGNDYVVRDGIRAGDQIIVSGSQNLADGSPVKIEP